MKLRAKKLSVGSHLADWPPSAGMLCLPHSRFASPPRSLLATVDTPAHLAETKTNTCKNKLDFCGLFAETPRHLCWMSFGPHRDSLFVSSSPSNKFQDSCPGICLRGLQKSKNEPWWGPKFIQQRCPGISAKSPQKARLFSSEDHHGIHWSCVQGPYSS